MNISSNLNAAIVASGTKGSSKTPGKADKESGAMASEPFESGEKVEFSGRAIQQSGDSTASVPSISSLADAEESVTFLKNVIIALPALVLRAQAHPVQEESGLQLL